MHPIRRAADGKLCVMFESTEGFPAHDLAARKLGAEHLRAIPADVLDAELIASDGIVAFRAGSPTGKRTARLLGLRLPGLGPDAYRIELLRRSGRRLLCVAGGDLFGMLAGLSDALTNGELNREAFLYRGGSRTETPAFRWRYYWTWDHSTNWVLDDEGNQFVGCNNAYCKKPETFIEDYRRLVDHCIDMRFNGIVIWGFLRDSHGGVESAYKVARYAADRGVRILPGVGTTDYGGIYYEGNHPCSIPTYLHHHPERSCVGADGRRNGALSPYHPGSQRWIAECVEWLYRTFPIGGSNMENGDFLVDHSPAAKRARARIRSTEADYFKDQYFAYKTALDTADRVAPESFNGYATYAGFNRVTDKGPHHQQAGLTRIPYFARHMPASAVAQWTLSGMLSQKIVPLRDWLRSPAPAAVYENPNWPRGLRPPTPRSAGFMHQASQWFMPTRRTDVAVSSMIEGCLRSHEAGLEGISVHGEVSSRFLAYGLNYLAMRHWTYHPVSTLEEFALAELAPRLGGESEARVFVQSLCDIEDGRTGMELEKRMNEASARYRAHADYGIDRRRLEVTNMWVALREWNCGRDAPNRYPYRQIAHGGGVA